MPHYAPELTSSVIDDYLHTGKPLALIARDHAIGERDVTRIRHAAGLPPRRARVRPIPAAMQALRETRALLRALPLPPRSGGEGGARRAPGGGPCDDANPPPTPDPSPPLAPLVGGGESAIDRIERLVEQELAAEEAGRAQFGLLPRAPGDAERCARTLAILTRTLHALARLRGGATEHGSRHDDDDIPADIDEFRRDLARRIEAFLESREADGDSGGGSAAAPPDDAR